MPYAFINASQTHHWWGHLPSPHHAKKKVCHQQVNSQCTFSSLHLPTDDKLYWGVSCGQTNVEGNVFDVIRLIKKKHTHTNKKDFSDCKTRAPALLCYSQHVTSTFLVITVNTEHFRRWVTSAKQNKLIPFSSYISDFVGQDWIPAAGVMSGGWGKCFA